MADEPTLLDTLVAMNAASVERAGLDERSIMLVRLAALAAVGSPPISYVMNLGAAGEVGLSVDEVRGALVAAAPIVGTAKVVAAAATIAEVLDLALALEDLEGASEA